MEGRNTVNLRQSRTAQWCEVHEANETSPELVGDPSQDQRGGGIEDVVPNQRSPIGETRPVYSELLRNDRARFYQITTGNRNSRRGRYINLPNNRNEVYLRLNSFNLPTEDVGVPTKGNPPAR